MSSLTQQLVSLQQELKEKYHIDQLKQNLILQNKSIKLLSQRQNKSTEENIILINANFTQNNFEVILGILKNQEEKLNEMREELKKQNEKINKQQEIINKHSRDLDQIEEIIS